LGLPVDVMTVSLLEASNSFSTIGWKNGDKTYVSGVGVIL